MTGINTDYAPSFLVTFREEDKETGRLWQEQGQLHFDGNATESARMFFEQVIKRNNEAFKILIAQNDELQRQLLAMEHDRDKWQNHHKTEVARARVLKNRIDMPVEHRMLYEALRLCEVVSGTAPEEADEYVVTTPEALDKVLAVYHAAEKLVRCKGRYQSELNYRALASEFGVTVPDLEPLDSDLGELTQIDVVPEFLQAGAELQKITVSASSWEKICQMLDQPAAPSEALRELMNRPTRSHVDITTPEDNDHDESSL